MLVSRWVAQNTNILVHFSVANLSHSILDSILTAIIELDRPRLFAHTHTHCIDDVMRKRAAAYIRVALAGVGALAAVTI